MMKQASDELEKRIHHLKTLYDVSQEIVFLKEPKEIIVRILLMIMGTYGSRQGIAFLLNDDQTAIKVYSERGLNESIEDGLIQLIEGENDKSVMQIDQSLLFDENFVNESDNKLLGLLASKGFAVFKPLKVKNKTIGGIALGRKLSGEPYTSDDLELLRTLINQGAVSIDNAMLHQRQLAQERVLKELEIAADIQLSFLPTQIIEVQGLDLATVFLPAKEVGGDFYDFIPLPENKLGIVIADVVGKGIPAALYMALSRALIRACSAHEPANMLKTVLRTNMLIQECTNADFFVTLVYAMYDPALSKLAYIRAGHSYPILYKKKAHNFTLLKGRGIALGMLSDITLEEKEVDLETGDLVVFYTDGVTEAINGKNEEFGIERLTRVIDELKNQPALVIAETIKNRVVDFAGGEKQFDDITLVVLKKMSADSPAMHST